MSTDREAVDKYGAPTGAKILQPEEVAEAIVFAVKQPEHVADLTWPGGTSTCPGDDMEGLGDSLEMTEGPRDHLEMTGDDLVITRSEAENGSWMGERVVGWEGHRKEIRYTVDTA
ncbi:hypothetical protein VTK73DRAFT_6437 [Phialemonium thermophilum]|uniref:Uncharacterized protein n=1 Tax=Phialemonium thermophilum TaxID=223376 RepID=A0ABR3V0N8_9PEZI